MLATAQNFSITEFKLCRLAINIEIFSYLLKTVDYDAVVEYLAQTHILKSRSDPGTNKIKRL